MLWGWRFNLVVSVFLGDESEILEIITFRVAKIMRGYNEVVIIFILGKLKGFREI